MTDELEKEVNDEDEEEVKAWYIINTFASKERQVKEDLEKRAKSMGIQDKIFRIICAEHEVPVLDEHGKQKMVIDKKTGEKVPKMKIENDYPRYLFVEMIMTDETWFIVRNTRGVSGITGSSGKGAKPFPVPREEIEPVLKRMNIIDSDMYSDYKEGDKVKLITGTWVDAEGEITSVNKETSEVLVSVMLFGRPQSIKAKFFEIEKVENQK